MAPPGSQSALSRIPLAGKIGLMFGAAAVAALGYWFVWYSDMSAKIEGAERQKKSLHDDLIQQQQAQTGYLADRDELALREQRARELNKVLPPDAEEDAFLSSVQAASNAAGIDLKAFAPQDEQPQTFYAKIPMKLEMGGKFQQIAKFAYELGKVDRIINVENIELTDPKLVGDEVVLRGRCLATAFHAIQPKAPRQAPGAPGAPGPVVPPAAPGGSTK